MSVGFDENTNEEAIRELTKLLASDKAIAFVGAGASAGLYPLWDDLIRRLAEEASRVGRASEEACHYWMDLARHRPQLAVRRIKLALGDSQFGELIKRIFRPQGNNFFTKIHAALMEMGFLGYVTTNFDHGLVHARARVRPDIYNVEFSTWKEADACHQWYTGDVFKNQKSPILFAHGVYSQAETVVLGASEYRKAYAIGSPYRRLFEKLWGLERLVFVGFGFSDIWLEFIADEVITQMTRPAPGRPRHFAILGLREDQPFSREMRLTFEDEYNAQVIFYPIKIVEGHEDHSGLEELLRRFIDAAKKQKRSQVAPLSLVDVRRNEEDDYVRELRAIENRYLQVLLNEFSLERRDGRGSQMYVECDYHTQSIWRPGAKSFIRSRIPDFEKKSKKYQFELDRFLLAPEEGDARYRFEDSEFWFRYASGGVLPVLRVDGKKYFCLFYRDVFPVGWNIANGGCHSVEELIDPQQVMRRELSEELMIVGSDSSEWYVFEWDIEKSLDRDYFRKGRVFWEKRFRELGWPEFAHREQIKIDAEFVDGTDALSVKIGPGEPRIHENIFLNINALDFGIEIDKVVIFDMPESAALLDGEINQEQVINRPVGVFDCEILTRKIVSGGTEFIPDWFFYNADRYDGSEFKKIVEEIFVRDLKKRNIRPGKSVDEEWVPMPEKFDLCPVTRRIIGRYLELGYSSIEASA